MDVTPARRAWSLLETVHAVTYFAPGSRDAWAAAGYRGFWRGYFATRAAPLGPVPAAVVTATFFGFHPAMVGRALPSVWEVAPPAAALEARAAGAAADLDALLGPPRPDEVEAAALARAVAEAATTEGRALAAANAALAWPSEPRPALWHAATLLREHRGDGHVAALVAADLDGCEALVLAAAGGPPRSSLQPHRGWGDDEWAAAHERLGRRGLVGPDGGATGEGRALRAEVEAATDRAASRPLAAAGAAVTERLCALLAPMADAVARSGVIPVPNPIGLVPGAGG